MRASIKTSTRRDFRDRRGELRNRRGQLKNQRGASFLKSWACLETTANLLFQTCQHLSHAESALRKSRAVCRSAFSDVSASVTCRVSFAEITGSLSKRRFQILKSHLLFQTCQRFSHVQSTLRKLQANCRRSLVK